MTETHFPLDDSPHFRLLELGEVTSTNDYLRHYRPAEERRLTLATAEHQTAGRGSGRNRWESAPGQNLLFSLLVRPRHIPAHAMFVLSEVMALSIREALNCQLKIKWPNDIYYADRKLCGMLIENDLQGTHVERSILGVGINVNQTQFSPSIPNPISLAQILGHEVERRFVLERVVEHFTRYYDWAEQGRLADIHQLYLDGLYRLGEEHPFRDSSGPFRATIVGVEPTGHLLLADAQGARRRYAFKEVEYVIND